MGTRVSRRRSFRGGETEEMTNWVILVGSGKVNVSFVSHPVKHEEVQLSKQRVNFGVDFWMGYLFVLT